MSATLLFIVSLIYWGVAIDQWWRGSPAGALVWASYDKMVSRLVVEKSWGTEGRTTVRIT